MARIKENHRAKIFIKRLKTVGIAGISLSSYRYAWAERAKTVGMPERFAQQALGHSLKAFARAYSKKANSNTTKGRSCRCRWPLIYYSAFHGSCLLIRFFSKKIPQKQHENRTDRSPELKRFQVLGGKE